MRLILLHLTYILGSIVDALVVVISYIMLYLVCDGYCNTFCICFSAVDTNTNYDLLDEETIDEQERYFDSEEPSAALDSS